MSGAANAINLDRRYITILGQRTIPLRGWSKKNGGAFGVVARSNRSRPVAANTSSIRGDTIIRYTYMYHSRLLLVGMCNAVKSFSRRR